MVTGVPSNCLNKNDKIGFLTNSHTSIQNPQTGSAQAPTLLAIVDFFLGIAIGRYYDFQQWCVYGGYLVLTEFPERKHLKDDQVLTLILQYGIYWY